MCDTHTSPNTCRGWQDICQCCDQRDETTKPLTSGLFSSKYCDHCRNKCQPGYFCTKTQTIGWNHPDYVDPFADISDEW